MPNNNITETFAATLSLSERWGDEDESSNEISIISLNKDIIILLASYLNAQDMLIRLALCCKRFGKRDEAYAICANCPGMQLKSKCHVSREARENHGLVFIAISQKR